MYKKLKIESNINNLRIIENAIDEVMSEIGITAGELWKNSGLNSRSCK